jgi:hypothetical protein
VRACEEKSLKQDIRGDVERFAGRMESEVSSTEQAGGHRANVGKVGRVSVSTTAAVCCKFETVL